ncbi:hypothetical protein MPSEU_000983400 [Mayamaea pseudoterrestris]|nr:hypothetical protein MPSEU_000983400 [Mayamaea pseudoterrestris]
MRLVLFYLLGIVVTGVVSKLVSAASPPEQARLGHGSAAARTLNTLPTPTLNAPERQDSASVHQEYYKGTKDGKEASQARMVVTKPRRVMGVAPPPTRGEVHGRPRDFLQPGLFGPFPKWSSRR